MAVGRVTHQQLWVNSQQSISAVKTRLSALQEQASSGTRINRPSDDPVAAATTMRLGSELAANTQYSSNITDGLAWLSTADSALSTSEDLVRSARDLTIQAANAGTSTATSREAVAVQLESLKADLLAQANTKYLGRSVFAGTSDAAAAFTSSGTFSGATGGTGAVQRRVSATETIRVSADGAAAYGTPPPAGSPGPGTSVFQAIDRVVTALRSGSFETDPSPTGPQAAVRAGIDDLKASLTRLSATHAAVGSDYSRLEAAKVRAADAAVSLTSQRAGVQDVDPASVLLELKTQEIAYQTALAVTAQVLQPTLMSFLR